jgi:hypothetical protein
MLQLLCIRLRSHSRGSFQLLFNRSLPVLKEGNIKSVEVELLLGVHVAQTDIHTYIHIYTPCFPFHLTIFIAPTLGAGWKCDQAAEKKFPQRWAAAHLHKCRFWAAHNWQNYIWCNGWQVSFGIVHLIWCFLEMIYMTRNQRVHWASDLCALSAWVSQFFLSIWLSAYLGISFWSVLCFTASMNIC